MGSDFKYDVFLSYSSKDKEKVHALAQRLKQDGLRVWLDAWAILPGDSIPLKIQQGLERSRVLLMCMSPDYFASDWGRMEHLTLLFRDPTNAERRFIPLLIAECQPPDIIAQFARIDWRKASEESYAWLLIICKDMNDSLLELAKASPKNLARDIARLGPNALLTLRPPPEDVIEVFFDIHLKEVAKAYPKDSARGIARLGPNALLTLRLSVGDIIEIEGKRVTAAKVLRADHQDWSQDYIRIDGFIRQNAGVGIGDRVKIRKAKFANAQKIILAPPSGLHMHYGDEAAEMIRRQTLERPVVCGDILPIMSSGIKSFAGRMEAVPLEVAEPHPDKIVVICETTEIILLERSVRK